MTNVVSAELYKLRLNKGFFVCLLFTVVTSVFFTYISHDTSTVSGTMGNLIGSLPIFLAITASNIACSDYDKGTLKNVLSSGNSKGNIYMGKFVVTAIAALIYFLVDAVATVAFSYVMKGLGNFNNDFLPDIEALVAQVGLVVLYALIFYGLSMMFKSTKSGLISSILFYFGFTAVVAIVSTKLLHNKAIMTYTLDNIENNISALKFSIHMLANYGIYLVIAIGLNIIGFARFKSSEA